MEKQTYKDSESLIVIDGNEELYEKIKDYVLSNDLQSVRVILNPEHKGLSYCRNIGIAHTTGDIIAFVDDDTVLDPNWADALIKTFDDEEIGAVTGDVIPLWEHEEMSWFPKELHWMISCSYTMTPSSKKEVERGFGANMAFRKDLIKEIGMFDTSLGVTGSKNWVGGEDTVMFLKVRKAGKRIIFNPDIKLYHKIYAYRLSIKNIIKRAFGGGFSVALMKRLQGYNLLNSTEHNYLKQLLFEFYPKAFRELIKRPSIIPLKQMMIVGVVMLSEGAGCLYGYVK